MKKIEKALSNIVFLDTDNNKIIKKYSKDKFKEIYINQELNVLNKIGYKYNIINKNEIEIEYFKHEPFDDENISITDLISTANALKKLHNLNTSSIRLSPFKEVYEKFFLKRVVSIDKTEEYIFNKAMILLSSGKQVILHNDVVKGNLLKINNRIKLIDFEYSGLGNPIFDIASFITERTLTTGQIKIFIECYNKKINKDDLLIVSAFLQIFWTRWAL